MFNTLLFSRPKKARSPGSTAASVVLHVVALALAAVATARSAPPPPAPEVIHDRLIPLLPDEPIVRQPTTTSHSQQRSTSLAPAPAPTRIVIQPIDVPMGLPPIDSTFGTDVTIASSASTDVTAAVRGPVGPGGGRVIPGGVIGSDYADKPAVLRPGLARPRFPDVLRSAGVEGDVVVEFVIDTTGRVELPSVRVISSSHELFTAAVRSVLPALRFIPAEVNEHRVRVMVRQPYTFRLEQ